MSTFSTSLINYIFLFTLLSFKQTQTCSRRPSSASPPILSGLRDVAQWTPSPSISGRSTHPTSQPSQTRMTSLVKDVSWELTILLPQTPRRRLALALAPPLLLTTPPLFSLRSAPLKSSFLLLLSPTLSTLLNFLLPTFTPSPLTTRRLKRKWIRLNWPTQKLP